MRVTVDQLVEQLKMIDLTPINNATYTDQDLIDYMDQELHGTVVPETKTCMEEYFINVLTLPVGQNTPYVTIPKDAAGFALRDIYLYDQQDQFVAKCNRINPDQIPYLSNGLIGNTLYNSYNAIQYYYIENNNIVWWPTLSSEYRAKIRYFKSPNHLGKSAEVGAQITAKLASNQLQLDNVPADWTVFTGVNRQLLDFTTANSPYNFKLYPVLPTQGQSIGTPGIPLTEVPLVSVQPGFIIEVDADTWNAIDAGDFVWSTGYCGYVQYLPFEAYELIKLRASMRILKAQGDLAGLNVSAQLFAAQLDDYKSLISPKVQNMPRKITNTANLTVTRNRGIWR